MAPFARDIERFLNARKTASDEARQNAALFLICGVDLKEALDSEPEQKRKIILRLDRMIERERLKGSCRHWSYDLNRHIALKQAADRLRNQDGCGDESAEKAAAGEPNQKRCEAVLVTQKQKAAPKHRFSRRA